MSEVIEYPAPELTFCSIPETPWERECRAFWNLTPQNSFWPFMWRSTTGKSSPSGSEDITVGVEAYSLVSYVPLYVGQVTHEPQQPSRIPSPRIWRGKGRS